MRLLATIFALLFVLAAVPAHAQFSSVNTLNLSLTPQYPKPYEEVTVRVSSTLINLPSQNITIYVNGAVVSENEQSASFKIGAAGSKTTVRVVTTGTDGTNEKTLTITPADVALVLEPVSTTHPFYQGAGLVPPEGSVRIVALPTFYTSAGAVIAPENLVYSWKFGEKALTAQSGVGKNVLTATAPTRYRDAQVSVTVSTQDRSLSGQATILVSPTTPVLRVYRHDPLLGIDFTKALSGLYVLPEAEDAFRAVPYFFSNTPVISWTLNGADSGTDPDLTVRTTGVQKGTAAIGVKASGSTVFDRAESRFTIEFGNTSTGIFGF